MTTNSSKGVVGWIGLGAMGMGMATCLASQGFIVQAYDVSPPSLEKAVKGGCRPCQSPSDTVHGATVLGLMVVNAAQVEDVLFGNPQAANVLSPGSCVVVFSTCPPTALVALQQRLDALDKNIGLVDAPVSGGSTRAADGTLAIMVAGTSTAIDTARLMIEGLTRDPQGQMTVVGDRVGMASDFKLINQVYCAIQICVTGESMAFAKSLGLNPRMVYNIIRTASGDSFMFGNRVMWQLMDDGVPKSAMTIIAKDVGIVMDEARLHSFPAPLCAVAEQVFTAALGARMAKEDDGNVVKLWQRFGVPPIAEQGTEEEEMANAKELVVEPGDKPNKVLFVGLGAMGGPMAVAVSKAGINIVGYDVNLEAMDRFVNAGGQVGSDVVKEAGSAQVVVITTVSSLQAEAVLFGADGSSGISIFLPENATVVLCSTVAPAEAARLQGMLEQQGRGIQLVDAPVSGGPSRAATGDLAIMASGESSALSKASPVLCAMSSARGNDSYLHFIPGGVGFGSKMKAVNQLLAGIHICAAAEATAFARKKGMDLDAVFDVVSHGAARSYCMVDRGPRMLRVKPPVLSATTIFVKDLGMVLSEAKRVNCPVFLAAAAHQQFIRAASSGWGGEDDSSVSRLWEFMGVNVALNQ